MKMIISGVLLTKSLSDFMKPDKYTLYFVKKLCTSAVLMLNEGY